MYRGLLAERIDACCEGGRLVKLGHVALDGTKIRANASKHKAMSYGRMENRAAALEAEVAKWLGRAEAADAAAATSAVTLSVKSRSSSTTCATRRSASP